MRLIMMALATAAVSHSASVSAQETGAPPTQVATGTAPSFAVGDVRTGSPSNATTSVSATTIPQAMDRADDTPDPLSFSLGALFARGDFGADTDTTIQAYALGARLRAGNLRLTASLPYMRIRTDGVLFTGIDGTPVLVAPSSPIGRRTNDGFGDLTLGAAYTLQPVDAGTELELSGRVKLNTATESSGLSSGETDYAVGAQVTHPIGRFAPFASVTYRILGDSDTYRLRDGLAASAGASVSVGPRTLVLASYHYSRAVTELVEDSHEVFLGASTALPGGKFRLTSFGTAGLSSGAAAMSAGLALSRSF